MANDEFISFIPARLKNAAKGGHVAGVEDIIDDDSGKTQKEINTATSEEITEIKGGSTDSIAILNQKIATEQGRAQGIEQSLDNRLSTVEELAEISIDGGSIGIGTTADFESDDTSDLAKVPTVGAMLGGANDGVYDISARHNDTKYADLAAALGNNGANIPQSLRKGGMSVKFVQSSDNKYVQYRLTSNTFTTTETAWQKQGAEVSVLQNTLTTDNEAKSITIGGISYNIKDAATDNILCVQSYIGKGQTGVYSNKIYGLQSDKTYRLYILNPNISQAGLSGTLYQIKEYKKDSTSSTKYTVDVGGVIVPIIEFSVSDDFDYLQAYGRCENGIKFETLIVEIPSIQESWSQVFTSSTDNVLDIKNVISGVAPSAVDNTLHWGVGNIMSSFIPVGNATKMTISGYTTEKNLALWFMDETGILSSEHKISSYNLNYETPRTIDVPNGAYYALVSLQSSPFGHDFSNMKISLSTSAAIEDYSPIYLYSLDSKSLQVAERRINENLSLIGSASENIFDVDSIITGIRVSDTGFKFDRSDVLSEFIPLQGIKQITIGHWPSNSATVTRYMVFMSTNIANDAYIIGSPINLSNNNVCENMPFEVPSGARYLFITIGNDDTIFPASPSQEAINAITISRFNYVTDDKFVKASPILTKDSLLNGTIQEYSRIMPLMNDYERVKDLEFNLLMKRWIPYSIGTPANVLASDNEYARCNLLFFSDSHIDLINPTESLQNVRDTISAINKSRIGVDAILHAGDAITPFGRWPKEESLRTINRFFTECKRSKYPVLFAKGNHDLNDWDNLPADAFDDDDWGDIFFDYAETNYGIVRQIKANEKKSSWYYYDITDKKIRVICVDSQDTDKTTTNNDGNVKYNGGVCFYISNEQMKWIANTALSFNEEGWGVIFVIHQTINFSNQWYSCGIEGETNMESALKKLFDMSVAFNEHTTYAQPAYVYTPDSFFNLDAINKDFSFSGMTNKPHIITWLVGHSHADREEVIDGVNMIWIANGSCTSTSSDSRLARVPKTSTQNAFDILSIDTHHRKIYAFRYGAGVNCYGDNGDRFLPDGLNY